MSKSHRVALGLCALVLFALLIPGLTETLVAQPPPPTLPTMPDQAPIDGGLGLLAAAGGAYAWKRLRNTKTN